MAAADLLPNEPHATANVSLLAHLWKLSPANLALIYTSTSALLQGKTRLFI